MPVRRVAQRWGSERGQVKTRQQGNLEQATGENPHRQSARRAGHGTTAQGGTVLSDVGSRCRYHRLDSHWMEGHSSKGGVT